jgi:hypothetical protein
MVDKITQPERSTTFQESLEDIGIIEVDHFESAAPEPADDDVAGPPIRSACAEPAGQLVKR